MEINLGNRIRNFRKQFKMSQEMLAEALGVSVAAISKWERDQTIPELKYILEMAGLFGVSTDVLIGYEIMGEKKVQLEERIHELQRKKKYEEAALEAEKAIIRYPNDFSIIYRCGEMYQMMGLEEKNPAATLKGIELLKRSIELISQNKNPQIGEITIHREIASAYFELEKYKEGMELLKESNLCGMNDALIGYQYTANIKGEEEEALPFLIRSYRKEIEETFYTFCGFANLYEKKGRRKEALNTLLWLINYLKSLKIDKQKAAYLDKMIALFYGACGRIAVEIGNIQEGKKYLKEAMEAAVLYDKNPIHNMENILFGQVIALEPTVYDNLGRKAIIAVENHLKEESNEEDIMQYWEEIKNEKN